MGIVYLAQDTSLGRKVALKMISKQLVGSQEAITRFLLEARTTAKFSHQNIVTIHFVGQHEGLPYVALAYLRGETLQERIDRELRLELADALAVAQAIASALAEAHRHGVLHRDLKPDNVHLGRDGHVRVLDFGLAKLFDPNRDAPSSEGFDYRHGDMSMLQTQGAVGTPFYMAPEQWEGAELTGAADIWGWGVIVFAMLAGRLPYEEPSLVSQMTAVCRPKTAPRLSEFATVPPALDDLVAGCLAKDASERPELEALLDAVEQLTIKVPQSRDEETADQNEALVVPVQNSLRWLVAAVVAIGLVIMVVAIVMQSSSPEPETTPAIAAPSIVTAAPSAGATTEPAPLKPSTATATIALSASAPRPPSAITPPRSAAPRLAPPRLAPPPSTTPPPTKEPNWDTPN